LPEGWSYRRIGELERDGIIAEIQDGNHGERHPKASDYVEKGVPFIMARDLVDGRVDLDHCSHLTLEHAASLRVGFAKPGDVLLTHKATMGRVAIAPNAPELLVLTPQVTYYRIGDPKRLIPAYLRYAFESPVFQHQLNASSHQSTRKYISISAQRDLWLPVAPYDVQQRIVETLQPIDEKIENNRLINRTLEAMASAYFRSWFVEFDPVRMRVANVEPSGISEAVARLFPSELTDTAAGQLPNGWRMQPFDEIVDIVGGGTPKTDNPRYWDGPIPWFSIADAPQDGGVFVTETEHTITEEGLINSATRVLQPGTTIITARGTVGKVAIAGREMAMNQSCYALRPKPPAKPYFVYFATRLLVSMLRQQAHGSVFDTITRATFKSVKTVVPQPEIVEAFEQQVGAYMQRVLSGIRETSALRRIRAALLPRLLSGRGDIVAPSAANGDAA
jgi:type I restriction enzyme S subunit